MELFKKQRVFTAFLGVTIACGTNQEPQVCIELPCSRMRSTPQTESPMQSTTDKSLSDPSARTEHQRPNQRVPSRGSLDPEQMLSITSVAKLLDCSTRTVTRMEDAGDMPTSIRINSLKRWPRSVLVAWIKDGCKKPTRPKGGRH